MAESGPTLDDLRSEIDRIDDAMLDLLTRRAEIAAEIAPLKAGAPLLRPGREAAVLRRLVTGGKGGFDALALVRIWREIMSAALRRQGPFSVAVSAPEGAPTCWGLARAQYGAATPLIGTPGPAQAIAAVAAGQASVAVVPSPSLEEPDPWWPRLITEGPSAPRVVARLPVADGLEPGGGVKDGLAIAVMPAEPSGDDITLVAIETDTPMSRTAIVRAVGDVGFNVRFAATKGAGENLHLVEVLGFYNDDAPELGALRGAMAGTARHILVIGAYAVPLAVGSKTKTGSAS